MAHVYHTDFFLCCWIRRPNHIENMVRKTMATFGHDGGLWAGELCFSFPLSSEGEFILTPEFPLMKHYASTGIGLKRFRILTKCHSSSNNPLPLGCLFWLLGQPVLTYFWVLPLWGLVAGLSSLLISIWIVPLTSFWNKFYMILEFLCFLKTTVAELQELGIVMAIFLKKILAFSKKYKNSPVYYKALWK